MARPTQTPPMTITCEAWGSDEYVRARSVLTGGDRAWINEHSISSQYDEHAPDGISVKVNFYAQMIALAAKMTLSWTLKRDTTDQFGNVIYDEKGLPLQEPIPLPDSPEKRLEVIATLHEDDVSHIGRAINRSIPAPMSQQEGQSFLGSATGPTSES